MKICVLGNSHIGALKRADYSSIFGDPVPKLVFWGVPGKRFLEITCEGGRLIAPDGLPAWNDSEATNGLIQLYQFDVLILHGPPLNVPALYLTLRAHQSDLRFYSEAFLREGIPEFLATRPAIDLIRRIRANFKGRIFASPQPLVSAGQNFFGGQTIRRTERDILDDIVIKFFSGIGVDYVPQPSSTIVDEQYTAAAYCIATTNEKHANDISHMNGLYGTEVLRAIAARLAN